MNRNAKVCCLLLIVLSVQIVIAITLRPELLQSMAAFWPASSSVDKANPQHVVFKDCFPVSGTKSITFDAPIILSELSNETILPAGSSFAVSKHETANEQLRVYVYEDDQPRPLTIDRGQLWAVRFCGDYCRELKPTAGRNPLQDVSPCGWADRQEAARRIFALAFLSLQKGDGALARLQFEYGLKLNPLSAEGWFYYAESGRSSANGDIEPYRYALELGLPADLEPLARTRMSE